MIYWFQNLPLPLYNDKWEPVITHKWLRENFMPTAYLLQFVLFVLFMIYVRGYLPKVIGSVPVVQIPINRNMSYILIIAIFIIHEILHIAVIFHKGDFSITFSNLYIWITTNAELSKFRYFIFVFLPLLILTVIPFIISLFFYNNLTYVIRIFAFFNLIISSADILNTIFILPKPNKAIFCRGMYYIKT